MLELAFQQSPTKQYPVYIGEQILDSDAVLSVVANNHLVCVVDQQVVSQVPKVFHAVLAIEALDSNKTFEQLSTIFEFLLANNCSRSSYLFAIGGGVISDLCGMAAALFKRGLNLVNVPTTMLAQVDAAYGGKNGINYAGVKNLLGTIYPPNLVICDLKFLSLLPDRAYRQGIAEVIKHAVGFDAKLFTWLQENYQLLLDRDCVAMQHVISCSIKIKSLIVSQDEQDFQVRRKLNLGHTFAHAIEAASAYSDILHGEAVSIGIAIASYISMQKNYLSVNEYQQIINLLQQFALPYNLSNLQITVALILSHIQQDKKNTHETLCFILPYNLGRAELVFDLDYVELKELLYNYVSSTN